MAHGAEHYKEMSEKSEVVNSFFVYLYSGYKYFW